MSLHPARLKPAPVLSQALPLAWLLLGWIYAVAPAAEPNKRCSLWIDLLQGEPIGYEQMLDDLAGVRVVYLGERHTVARHHEIQARIVTELGRRGVPLVLGLEQMESVRQADLDRYAKGQITFDQLAQATDWERRWRGYAAYRPILEAARKAGAAILGLNARSETIRQIARSGGIEKLPAETRKQLPADIQSKDPIYEELLSLQMMVHMAATPERLRPMIEAQMARDETMAAVLASFLQSKAGRGRTAVVLCGAGHVAYGLGTAQRVRRRMPGVTDRILMLSESGDVELSREEKAIARPISITHAQLQELGRPLGDYLYATEQK